MEFVAAMTGQSLPNILKLFASKKVTGALELSEQDFKAFVWLRDGQIIFASSNKNSLLKDSLKDLNLITSDKINLLDNSSIDDYMIDRFIIDSAIVPPKILTYIRTHQIAETLYSILEMEKINYELKSEKQLVMGREDLLPAGYNWLVEIYQNLYPWGQIRSKVGRLAVKPLQKPLKAQELSQEEEKIYRLCDGKKTIKEVTLWSSTSYFKAYSILASLVAKGVIEFEESGIAEVDSKIIIEIVKILDNMEQMPGIKTALVVDKEGKVIAKDSRRKGDEIDIEVMAAIFSQTVSDFESNMKADEEEHSVSELIEQLLVERNNGDKTLLFVSGKVILVTEAFKDCDWGLLRLSAKRSMSSIRQLISVPS